MNLMNLWLVKMNRQAITVSIEDLEKQIKILKKEAKRWKYITGIKHKKWQLNIINKKPECSDTWEFE